MEVVCTMSLCPPPTKPHTSTMTCRPAPNWHHTYRTSKLSFDVAWSWYCLEMKNIFVVYFQISTYLHTYLRATYTGSPKMIDKKYVALRAIKMQQIKFYSFACFSTLREIWFRCITNDFSFEIEWVIALSSSLNFSLCVSLLSLKLCPPEIKNIN